MKTISTILIVSLLIAVFAACAAPVPTQAPAASQPTEASSAGRSVFLDFNLGVSELQKPEVREAIFRSIDRETLVNEVYQDKAHVATSPFSPALKAQFDISPTPVAIWSYDTSEGRKLLSDAGLTDGFTINLYIPDDPSFPEAETIATRIARNLKDVGITVGVQKLPMNDFQAKKRSGELQGLYLILAERLPGDPMGSYCGSPCAEPPPNSYGQLVNTGYRAALSAPTENEQVQMLEGIAAQYIDDWGRVWIADLTK